MTLPDFLKLAAGAAIVWGEPGATVFGLAVTHAMSVDGLANGAGRNGVFADLGVNWDLAYSIWIAAETGSAPTAGALVEAFLAGSHSSSVWPGKATGTDAAYSATPSVAANKALLGADDLFTLQATAETNSVLTANVRIFQPKCRFIAPVYINSLGVAIRDEATNSANGSGIVMVPVIASQVE
jgi:hypothetical protein